MPTTKTKTSKPALKESPIKLSEAGKRRRASNIKELSPSWTHPKLGRIPIGASLEKVNLPQPSPIMSMAEMYKLPKPYKAVSFFSGCGGGSLGLKQSGFNVLYANEFVPAAAATYKLNAPETIVDRRDIRKVTGHDVLKRLGLQPGDLDMFEMSPPCKSFSNAQAYKKGRELGEEINYCDGIWQRVDDLFFEGARILKVMQPKAFLAENVKGLLKDVNRGVLVEVFQALRACGYHVEARVLDASRMGIPQRRERLIFVGVRNDLIPKGVKPNDQWINWPKPDKHVTGARDFFPHIMRIKHARGFVDSALPYETVTASDHSIGLSGSFSRGTFSITNEGKMRRLTLPELRRVSGLPDDFKLVGSFIQRWERCGRILVPEMYRRLGESLKQQVLEPYYGSHTKHKRR